ncbi:MAG: hypothetical protein RSP_15720 [Rhodanobacter sp.]
MSMLHLTQAQQQFPHAWQCIADEMEREACGYDATLTPITAEVIVVDGEQVLEVVAVSDIRVVEGGEDSFARMTFHAKLTQS